MTGSVHHFPTGLFASQAEGETAPALPVAGHIVAAALAAERVRALSAQVLLLLQHVPNDTATFDRLQAEILDAWSDLDDRYRAYHAVLTCEGQA